ncbi:hypothetical protein CBL_12492 [Carabus blaptoides fortunei]
MGITKIAAEHALYYTGNQSAEAAASYVFDNPDIDVMPPLVKPKKSTRKSKSQKKSEHETESSSEEDVEPMDTYKMVFVVNIALNMGVGKVASQVAHACLGIFRLLTEFDHMRNILDDWETEGEKKVVLRGENHLHLQELEALAKTNQLFSHLIHDAGRTQIPPNSVTVLALFGPCNRVDTVTGELSLL